MQNLVVFDYCNFYPVIKSSLISRKPPSSPTFPPRHVRLFSPFVNRSVRVRMALPLPSQNPVVEPQKVIISNKHGEKLVGLLHDTGSNEIVILCHGFRSTKENDTMVNLANALGKEGTSSFRFDFSGNGESEGSFAYGNYWREADDLHAVMEHFRGASRAISAILGHSKGAEVRSHVRWQRMLQVVLLATAWDILYFWLSAMMAKVSILNLHGEFLTNTSKDGYLSSAPNLSLQSCHANNVIAGGDVVLLYASKYHDISTVFNVSGRYDLKRGIEERIGKDFMEKIKQDGFIDVKNRTGSVIYRVTEESLMDRLNTDIHKACLVINKDCRVVTIHGSADEIIPLEDALEFAKIIPNHSLHIIEGANHSYTSHQTELASVVLKFMKATSQQD
ncbi:hypothetical protein DKX38_028107 [Salix brachista]|uniref:Serine aminopeptidase S33 domain-containing protein n=1 Tax=Salix brachista TaxID=2182728 RepID=A0A5N5J4U1_9ROSI|nr:hypothetical protein DKX38_028107 [Salix brachista]